MLYQIPFVPEVGKGQYSGFPLIQSPLGTSQSVQLTSDIYLHLV